jgi:predicted dehydrogenase
MKNETKSSIESMEVGVGLIGAGIRFLSILKHLLPLSPGIQIKAIYDPAESAVTRCQDSFAKDAVACASVEELCARDDIDWVFIGSWNSKHAEQAIAALRAGKHVFCEKPLALTTEEGIAIKQACLESGRTFALGLVLRYSPLYRALHSAINSGKIGKILSFEFNETLSFSHGGYIHGNWRRFTENAGPHILEKCCHDIDLALWLIDSLPVRVASFGGLNFFLPKNEHHQERLGPGPNGEVPFQHFVRFENENPFKTEKNIIDNQVAILEFDNEVRATFHTSCLSAMPERRFYIMGDEGTLRADAHTGLVELKRIGWNEPVQTWQSINGGAHAGSDIPMCQELAECMAGLRAPAAGIEEGMRSLVVAEGIDQAMRTGQVVDLRPVYRSCGIQLASE